MKKQFFTKDGMIERETTPEELTFFANLGSNEAKKAIAKEKFDKALTIEEKVAALSELIK